MAPKPRFLMSSGSKKEPRNACLTEARATNPNTALCFHVYDSPFQSASDGNMNHIVGATKVFLVLQYSLNDDLLHSTEARTHAH